MAPGPLPAAVLDHHILGSGTGHQVSWQGVCVCVCVCVWMCVAETEEPCNSVYLHCSCIMCLPHVLYQIVYMTVSFPFIILLVLLIRYVTLDGQAHLDGIYYYIKPDWSRLQHAEVWGDAASQLFFSLSLSQGTLLALSSYNRFHYNCYRYCYQSIAAHGHT